jgi:hypothetical protein
MQKKYSSPLQEQARSIQSDRFDRYSPHIALLSQRFLLHIVKFLLSISYFNISIEIQIAQLTCLHFMKTARLLVHYDLLPV